MYQRTVKAVFLGLNFSDQSQHIQAEFFFNAAAAHNEIIWSQIFAYCKQELTKVYFDGKR